MPSQAERFARYGADERVPERMRRALAQRAALPFPLDLRLVDPVDKVAPRARPARQLAWMRAPEPLGDDPALHRCVVAYGSDFALLETALLPHATAVPDAKLVAASIGAARRDDVASASLSGWALTGLQTTISGSTIPSGQMSGCCTRSRAPSQAVRAHP